MNMNNFKARLSTLKFRLQVALPLIPVFSGILFFMAILSPIAWNEKGSFSYGLGALGIILGIVCAYCTGAFVEECFKRFGGQSN